MGFGALLAIALALPFFQAVADHSVNLLVLFALAGIVASCLNGACVGIIGDLFPTFIRFSGVALGVQHGLLGRQRHRAAGGDIAGEGDRTR